METLRVLSEGRSLTCSLSRGCEQLRREVSGLQHQGGRVFPLAAVDVPLPPTAASAHVAPAGDGLAGAGGVQQLLRPAGTRPGHEAQCGLL